MIITFFLLQINKRELGRSHPRESHFTIPELIFGASGIQAKGYSLLLDLLGDLQKYPTQNF